ncbi:uncharacterized protein LOC126837334 [Adelges cooleyi]|uniref:uncharacterized protein LOC126837334 n=1 Tax=Adelges cooleyi TaxID=133065 RepID=UPI00218006BF|nr:uncharacterized protein LOC126837334 [Adelges cooleyi]
MVPPGTSTVLRSRRRDASLKPNRTLDRTSSRGMLYENEELRLRTININAEVEKGQYYIKKLRRENQQLKREIWNLREEYERLENYVKSREQSENEEEEDEGKLITDEEQQQEISKLDSFLSTVIEENDLQDQLQIIEEEKDNTFDTGELQVQPEICAPVDEVIEATDPELRDKLRGVRLVDDRCYMTFGSAYCMEKALHTTLKIREVPVLLMDTGAGATMLSLTGVPETVADKEVLRNLKKYGTIIGGVERKTCRGMSGGERYVRVRLTLGSPRYLWFGSNKAIVRQLTEHETGTMNSIARRKSFKSQIKLNLKMADPSTLGSPIPDEQQGKENGTAALTAAAQATTPSVQQSTAFRFPSDPKINTAEPRAVSRASIKSVTGAGKKTAGQESPIRGRRRPSLMGFRRETIKHRGGSLPRGDGEDAESDTSTICRRKLSMTGRENTEKVPWCGCWGNGCL